MDQYRTVRRAGSRVESVHIDEGLRAYMNRVYGLMAMAMVITGVVAYIVGSDFSRAVNGIQPLIVPFGLLEFMYVSAFKWIIMLSPLGVVLLFGATVHKMSKSTAQTVFWLFAGLVGLSIATIFAIYTGVSIAQTFFATAIAFAGLSLWGYTTKRDISGWGSFLIMGVIGLIVASLANIFIGSSAIAFAVSLLGVLIFAGLTAYDTQRIKNSYIQMANSGNTEWLEKSAIMGALNLYLNFLNMFMFLLQFMGSRE